MKKSTEDVAPVVREEKSKPKVKKTKQEVVEVAPEVVAPAPKGKKDVAPAKPAKKKLVAKELGVDKNGISLTPIRIKNLLLNVIFNHRAVKAEGELKAHYDALLEAANLKNGYESFHGFSDETREYIRELRERHFTMKRVRYEREQVKALLGTKKDKKEVTPEVVALLAERKQMLKDNPEASLQSLFLRHNKKFYANFTEISVVDGKAGEEAYKFYKSLIGREKIRLNDASKLRITCFMELVLRQLVTQANVTCVLNNTKKTINLDVMNAGTRLEDNYLYSIVENLGSWKKASEWVAAGRGKDSGVYDFINLDAVNPNNKIKFSSHVADICRYVSRGLVSNPPKLKYAEGKSKQDIVDCFESLNVSKEFREFCIQVLLELIYNFGSSLQAVSRTRKDRTVDRNLVDAVINIYHITFNQVDKLEETYRQIDEMVGRFTQKQVDLKKTRTNNFKKKAPGGKKKAPDVKKVSGQ